MENELKKLKISRDRKFGVGKKMGNQIWFYKEYINDFMDQETYIKYKGLIPDDFSYDILRLDIKANELAFISSPDFNTSQEPIVSGSYRVKDNNGILTISPLQKAPQDPLIYHHKWLFVKDDYKGFDIEESKKRSIEWKTFLGVNKDISNRIGRLSFWDNWLDENNLEKRIVNIKESKMTEENKINEELPDIWKIYEEISADNKEEKFKEQIILTKDDGTKVEQKIPSDKTARLQIPRSFKIIESTKIYNKDTVLMDVGCGNSNQKFKSSIEKLGIDYNGCDLYNQPQSVNLAAIHKCKNGGADIVTSNNVLNTIAEEEIREAVLQQCKDALNPETGICLIITYEGMKNKEELKWEEENGQKLTELTPIKTRDGFQNRMETELYMEGVLKVFPNAKLTRLNGSKVIAASINPDLDLDLKKKVKNKSKNKLR